jgi:death on curing protein
MESFTVAHVRDLSFELAKELLSFNEPIPDFNTRFPHRLEACLFNPFATFEGKDLYPTLIGKAAILFYGMIKGHPFQNGNKRIALTTLFTFLFLSGKWLKVQQSELLDFTVWVAESRARAKKPVLDAIQGFIQDYLIDIPSSSGNVRMPASEPPFARPRTWITQGAIVVSLTHAYASASLPRGRYIFRAINPAALYTSL